MNSHMNIFRSYSENNNKDIIENNLTRALAICLNHDAVFAFSFFSKILNNLSITPDNLPVSDMQVKTSTLVKGGIDVNIEGINKIYPVSITATKACSPDDYANAVSHGTDNPQPDLIFRQDDNLIVCEVKTYDGDDCLGQLKNQVERIKEEMDKLDKINGQNTKSELAIEDYKSLTWSEIILLLESTKELPNFQQHFLVEDFHDLLISSYPSWYPARKLHEIDLEKNVASTLLRKRVAVITSMINLKGKNPEENNKHIKINDYGWADRFEILPTLKEQVSESHISVKCWPGLLKYQGWELFPAGKKNWGWLSFEGAEIKINDVAGSIHIEPHLVFYNRGGPINELYLSMEEAKDFCTLENFCSMVGQYKKEGYDQLSAKLEEKLGDKWRGWNSSWNTMTDNYNQFNMIFCASFYAQFPLEALSKFEENHSEEEITQFYIDVMDHLKEVIRKNEPYQAVPK